MIALLENKDQETIEIPFEAIQLITATLFGGLCCVRTKDKTFYCQSVRFLP